MADEINAKDDGKKFAPHPEGQYAAVCVDTVDLGGKVEQYGDEDPYVAKKCALVFRTGVQREDGEAFDVSQEFTISMNERANLRKFLEDWRGKSYTEQEAEAGVPLHKLVKQPCLISVEHKKSARGRTYARIKSVAPLPKVMQPPVTGAYSRPEFWDEKKKEYAAAVAKLRAGAETKKAVAAGVTADFSDFPEAIDEEDDDLPF